MPHRTRARPHRETGLALAAIAVAVVAAVAGAIGATLTLAAGPAAAAPTPLATCPTTLQALVDAAPAGATVTAPPCVFTEAVTIRRPITLRGPGATISGRDVPGGPILRDYWLAVAADDVTIEGFTFRDAGNPPQTGAVRVEPGVRRFVLRDSDLAGAMGAAVSFGVANDSVVEENRIHDNGQLGIHMGGDDVNGRSNVVRGNTIGSNNAAGANDPEWEAGGLKATRQVGLLVLGNEVIGNRGPGIWCDIACRDIRVEGNIVRDNTHAGIMFEVSSGAVIRGNVASGNGWGKASWGWGAGILVSSSGDALVTENTVAWNYAGISVISQDRRDWPHRATGNRVADNVVAGEAGQFLLFWGQDWDGLLFRPESGNGGSGNRFWAPPEDGRARFGWQGELAAMAAFAALPGGSESAYVSADERDRLLVAAGIPVAPASHEPRRPGPLERGPLRSALVEWWPLLAAGVMVAAAALGLVVWRVRRRRRLTALQARVHAGLRPAAGPAGEPSDAEPEETVGRAVGRADGQAALSGADAGTLSGPLGEGTARMRRVGWGIADQALSSGTNFALSVVMARTLSLADFGAFALAFAVYLFFISVARAYPMDPLAIRYSRVTPERWRHGAAAATGTVLAAAVLAAVLLGGLALVGAGVLGPVLTRAFTALAVVLPGLALQDAWRMAFFAAGRGRAAFINDAVWAVLLVPAMVVAWQFEPNVHGFMLAWGAAATVAAIVGIGQAGVAPKVTRVRSWWREHADVAPRFLAEASIRTGAAQLVYYGIGIAAGLAAVGLIREAALVVAPAHVVFMGITATAVPEGVRALQRSAGDLWRFAALISGALVMVALAWVGVVLLADPVIGNLVVGGDDWPAARTLLVPTLVALAGSVGLAGPQMILRAIPNAGLSLRAGIASAAVGLLVPIAFATGGTSSAAWGLAVGALIGLALWWLAARVGMDRR